MYDIFEKIALIVGIPITVTNLIIFLSSICLINILWIFIAQTFLGFPFRLSSYFVYLKAATRENFTIRDSFYGFTDYWSAVKLFILVNLKIFLWSLLFFIPGIIKGYAYSLAPYVRLENPSMSVSECLKESERITYGYKKDLFLLDLSFIGWNILTIFTLGILSIWVEPYYNVSKAHAYLQLRELDMKYRSK